jgi:hypothetical protein
MNALFKQICNYCFLLFAVSVYSQQIQVISEYGNVLEGAKIVVNKLDGSLVSIESTDQNGTLILPNSKEKFTLVVSYLGFITKTVSWDRQKNDTLMITLKSSIEDLDTIQLAAKQSITKSGDTTIVELERYKTAQDKRFTDVLRKLLGVNVSNDGNITYRGKPITDVLVNGAKLFDRDYQKAVNSLSPEEMIKLKFIEKYSDNSGFKKGEAYNTAIDINFVKPVVQSLNGTAVKGQKDFIALDLNYFLIHNSKASYLDLGFNNLGKSQARFFQTSSIQANQNSIINHYKLPDLSYLGSSLDDYLLSLNSSFSINNNTRLTLGKDNKHELLVKARNYWEKTIQTNTASSILFDNDGSLERLIISNKSIKSRHLEGGLQHTYTMGKHFFFNEIVFSNRHNDNEQSLDLNGSIQNFQRINKEVFFNISSTYQFKRSDSLITEAKGTMKWVGQNLSSFSSVAANQFQKNNTSTVYVSTEVTHPFLVSKSALLGLSNVQNYALHHAKNNILFNQNQNTFLSQNNEHLFHNRSFVYGEYIKLKNKFQYAGGLDYFFVKDIYANNQLLPYARIAYNKLSLRSNHTVQLSLTNDWLANSYRFTNPLRSDVDAFIIRSYQNEVASNFSFSYQYSYNSLFTSFTLGLQHNVNDKVEINAFDIDTDQTLNETIVLSKTVNNTTANTQVTKFIKFLKGNLQYQLVYSRQGLFTSLSRDLIQPLTVQSFNQQLEFKKRFNKKLYASLYYKQTNQLVDLVSISQKNKLSAAGIWLNYQFKNWNIISNSSFENLGNDGWYHLADVRVEFTPLKKPYYLEFSILNIFNERFIENQDIGVNYNTTSRTNVAGARYLVSFNYTF